MQTTRLNDWSQHDPWPEELRFLWDTEVASRDLGGLVALRGFYYQYLYALRLMREVLAGRFDNYGCECLGDFLVWKNASGVQEILLVQVRTKINGCVLRQTKDLEAILDSFARATRMLRERTSSKISYRLVYNPVHNCEAKGCCDYVRRSASFVRFTEDVGVSEYDTEAVEFQRFISIPTTVAELEAELSFLPADTIAFLKTGNGMPSYIRAIIGLIAPMHSARAGQSLSDPSRRGEFPLWQLTHTRRDAKETIENALEAVQAQIRRQALNGRNARRIEKARNLAENEIRAAPIVASAGSGFLITYDDSRSATHAMTVRCLLPESDERYCLSDLATTHVSRIDRSFVLAMPGTDTVDLLTYVTTVGTRHCDRVGLILALAETLAAFADSGIAICEFRASQNEYRDLYRVRQTQDGPRVILCDYLALALDDRDDLFSDARSVRGSLISDIVCWLYYGCITQPDIERTTLYCAEWNDNVVLQYAAWVRAGGLIPADELLATVRSIFEDERGHIPLFVTNVSGQFVRDCVDNEVESAAEALASAKPTHMLQDHSARDASIIYALWRHAQVGLLESSSGQLTLHRYTPYLSRRWESSRRRDVAIAVDLQSLTRKKLAIVFLGAADQSDAVLGEIFGMTAADYEVELQAMRKALNRRRKDAALPPQLRLEEALLKARRENLHRLSAMNVQFDNGDLPSQDEVGGATRLCLPGDPCDVINALRRLGYDRSSWGTLSFEATDVDGLELRGNLVDIRSEPGGHFMDVILDEPILAPMGTGSVRLYDGGADKVVRSEETLCREVVFAISSGQPVAASAVSAAWRLLEAMIGEVEHEEMHQIGLWNGRVAAVGMDAAPPSQGPPTPLPEGGWHVISGAAGTGKTRRAMHVAHEYLRANIDRDFPPARILVVGPTHVSVDNAVRAFREVSNDAFVPYRVVPPRRVSALLNRDALDPGLYEWSVGHYKRAFDGMTGLSIKVEGDGATDHSSELRRERDETLFELGLLGDGRIGTTIIGSHERWRRAHACLPPTRVKNELETRLKYLDRKLERLAAFSDVSRRPERDRGGAELYAMFQAPIVAVTVDALDRLPDMHFDLVVVEEASQVSRLKLLKTMRQVIRGSQPEYPTTFLLSGDPRQLTPYLDRNDRARARQEMYPELLHPAQDEVVLKSPLVSICSTHPKRVTTLTRQHRMSGDIATLVNSLFYSDQSWTAASNGGGRLCWIDTSAANFDGAFGHVGRSRFNIVEQNIVHNLATGELADVNDLLIISPYLAQVRAIRRHVGPLRSVLTVDSCQGQEASCVVISFVSFGPLKRGGFLSSPFRMNVALSRARTSLYLIGNLSELAAEVGAGHVGDGFPHLNGLAEMFSTSGYFSDRVRPASSYLR